jgi:hypothetical protein
LKVVPADKVIPETIPFAPENDMIFSKLVNATQYIPGEYPFPGFA